MYISYSISQSLTSQKIFYPFFRSSITFILFNREDVGQIEGSYSEQFVSLHDLLRDLAIYESSLVPQRTMELVPQNQRELVPEEQREKLFIEITGNKFPVWWTDLQQQPVNAHLLSITTGLTS